MVIAYHIIIAAYGFWLPNDPRGSGSDYVRSWRLYQQGPVTHTHTRQSVASPPHDRLLRAQQHAPCDMNLFPSPTTKLTQSHAWLCKRHPALRVHYSCMRNFAKHAHLAVAHHRYEVEQITNQLKGEATKDLNRRNLHPFPKSESAKQHSPWADDSWNVFLQTTEDIQRTIRYVQDNPTKEGRPYQSWDFVTPYRFEG